MSGQNLYPSALVNVEYVEGCGHDHASFVDVLFKGRNSRRYYVSNVGKLRAYCLEHGIPFVHCGVNDDNPYQVLYFIEGEKAAVEVKIEALKCQWPPPGYGTSVRSLEYVEHRGVWEAEVYRSTSCD
ncbi:MAG: hypothetical protein GY832_20225 [Chloroflexi bacterium]|nr:hypothetical protein [Chloroflexota bacterium]